MSARVAGDFPLSSPRSGRLAFFRTVTPVPNQAATQPRVRMTKSELIEILAQRQGHLKADDVDLAVKSLLEMMGGALAGGERIEIRGFGSFSLHYRPPRTGRNPKTGDAVALPGKHVPHFKPGKELRERVTGVVPLPAQD
ncbi:MAG: integration host factor subunit beta [Luteimonas sp.]